VWLLARSWRYIFLKKKKKKMCARGLRAQGARLARASANKFI
jgi:hypothetical protein